MKRVTVIGGIFFKAKDAPHCGPGARGTWESMFRPEKIDESEYGKFAWVIDLEGNKVEMWQPPEGQ